MNLHTSSSIIIRQMDFKESDKIITFLTQDAGKVSGIVRGVKKVKTKHHSRFEPLSCLNIFYLPKKPGQLVSIRKADPVHAFHGLRTNYQKILYGSYFSELMYLCEVSPEESHAFYELLLNTLHQLEESSSLGALRFQFEHRLLELLGWNPYLETCCQCARPVWKEQDLGVSLLQSEMHQLDVAQGGIRCPQCLEQGPFFVKLSPGTLIYWKMQQMPQGSQPKLTKLSQQEWNLAFLAFFSYHAGTTPKSQALLR